MKRSNSTKQSGQTGLAVTRASLALVLTASLQAGGASAQDLEPGQPMTEQPAPAAEAPKPAPAPAAQPAPTPSSEPAAPKGITEPVPASGNTVVRDGDTMWDLSQRYFGNPYEWPRMWSYNPEITNPHWIYPGHVLRLREGAEGGNSVAPPPGERDGLAPGQVDEALLSTSSRFGQGFGARRLARSDGSILIGEQVYLDNQALEHAGRILGSSEDHMMLSPTDEVYVKFDKGGEAPSVGKELTVFRHVLKKENSPQAGRFYIVAEGEDKKGEIVRVLGSLRVASFDEKNRIARAVITEAAEPIERGFEVTDVPREMVQVAPATNDRRIESKVLAATRPLGTLGHNQLVFIGVGEKQGVKRGNRFLVLRQGDTWRKSLSIREDRVGAERPATARPKDSQYPWEPIAEIRVLYVRPDSCTGIITSSREEVAPGDRVEMPEGF